MHIYIFIHLYGEKGCFLLGVNLCNIIDTGSIKHKQLNINECIRLYIFLILWFQDSLPRFAQLSYSPIKLNKDSHITHIYRHK